MIFTLLVQGLFIVIKALFGLLPNLPGLPDVIGSSIEGLFDLIFDNVQLLGFFIPITTIKIIVPSLIVLINFKHIYHFIIWILKKIPFSID